MERINVAVRPRLSPAKTPSPVLGGFRATPSPPPQIIPPSPPPPSPVLGGFRATPSPPPQIIPPSPPPPSPVLVWLAVRPRPLSGEDAKSSPSLFYFILFDFQGQRDDK
ncbi:hypothetical protein Scep_011758 [Stephania cephalantha]|uniref:Uncharacterized protein n=1 Tax=Stephania cephalantha TaxID=152367 RepID=A0AAP0JET4_9MAGN